MPQDTKIPAHHPQMARKWLQLRLRLRQELGKKPRDLQGVLFLIGIQELGQGVRAFSKEEKQDLLHIAICKVLSRAGYYSLKGYDREGWPHWQNLKKLPAFDLLSQEDFLKHHIIDYFEQEIGWQLD